MTDYTVAPLTLEPRDAEAFAQAATSRLAAYLPGLRVDDGTVGAALAQVFARNAKALADAVNQAPEKNELAFFDLLGVELLPAQAARAPIVFRALANIGDSRVPAGTRVGAKIEGRSDPLVFETEDAIALASAKIAQVATLWPGRDAYADHTAAALAGAPFTLFDGLVPLRHELYVAHDMLLNLTGRGTVALHVELRTPASAPLALVWEYWDGDLWRAFKAFVPAATASEGDSVDGTNGLTRSGIIRLATDCSSSARTKVNDIDARWIRARTTTPLVPGAIAELPSVDRITLDTMLDRSLPPGMCASLSGTAGIVADQAYADERKLDLTKSVQPLGARPQIGSSFLIACDEIFAKPGAEVTLCFRRVLTQEEKADQVSADFAVDVDAAQKIVVDAATDAANALINVVATLTALAWPIPVVSSLQQFTDARDALATKGIGGIAALATAGEQLITEVSAVSVALEGLEVPGTNDLATLLGLYGALWANNLARVTQAGINARFDGQSSAAALDELGKLTPTSAAMAAGAKLPTMDDPVVVWEYWNGARWTSLTVSGPADAIRLRDDGPVKFTVPDDIDTTTLNNVEARWIRARLTSGGYGLIRTVSWLDANSGKTNVFPIFEVRPPTIERVLLGYTWHSKTVAPEHCLTYNDFRFDDVTDNAIDRGDAFEPFALVEDRTPGLYLGFDKPLPADVVSLWFDIDETAGTTDGPPLVWEAYDGSAWTAMRVTDGTHALALPGTAAALNSGAGTTARFGDRSLSWIRARLEHDEEPPRPMVRAIALNAAWAAQRQTIENENLGSSTGEPGQVFFARNLPVLDGEVVEVRELSAPRAAVEEPLLRQELAAAGFSDTDIRIVTDPRTGRTSEVWVRWRPRANLLFAEAGARVYAIERSRGRILFGGGAHGRIPPAGRDAIRLSRYRSGGGVAGNVPKGAITQLLAGVLAEGISNPRAAEGGAGGEPLSRVVRRAPWIVRHRMQAISLADYEALAIEASPAVAVARALPTTDGTGQFAPGAVTVCVVPQATDPRPLPSFELREQVRRFIAARAPAAIARRVSVISPTYFPVDVTAAIAPLDQGEAATVRDAVRAALGRFLHPLTGGPWGTGWSFGRDVYLSDVAALVESIRGVDYVESLTLAVHGAPVGDVARVPAGQLLAAGSLALTFAGAGG